MSKDTRRDKRSDVLLHPTTTPIDMTQKGISWNWQQKTETFSTELKCNLTGALTEQEKQMEN
jgi:hypothetical protein